jgi:hypothetical protein
MGERGLTGGKNAERLTGGQTLRDLTGGQNTGSFVLVGLYKKSRMDKKSTYCIGQTVPSIVVSLHTTVRLLIQSPLCFAAF